MRITIKAAVLAGILVVAGAQQAQAQQAQRVVSFNAPFAFAVEGTKLPAGEYSILEQSGWVQIQAKDGKSKAQVLTLPLTARGQKTVENSHVVFHDYAGHLFLAEVWASGEEKGRELIESREEQQLAKKEKMAAVSLATHTVAAK